MTRDNMLEGDSGASGFARRLRPAPRPPDPLRIHVPADVAANFEGLVVRVAHRRAGGAGTSGSWCARSTTRRPGPSRVFATCAVGPPASPTGPSRSPDQWELYDLDDDPIEASTAGSDSCLLRVPPQCGSR